MDEEARLKYYVYTLARPDGRVFYVGKGCGNRIDAHEKEARKGADTHKCRTIRKIWSEGGEVVKDIVFRTNDEQESFDYEIELIQAYGFSNLTNGTFGGEGGRGNFYTKTPEQIEKSRQMIRAYYSDESVRRAHGAKMRQYYADNPDVRQRMLEAAQTPESRQKRKDGLRRAVETTDFTEKISLRKKELYQDPERREELRRIASDSWRDPEVRARRTASIKEALAKRKAKQLADALYNADPRNFDQLTLF